MHEPTDQLGARRVDPLGGLLAEVEEIVLESDGDVSRVLVALPSGLLVLRHA